MLRVAAILGADGSDDIFATARNEALKWAANRTEGWLPEEAWHGKPFEHLKGGGRNVFGELIEIEGRILWALKADDPDKKVPGRIWTTEVAIGREGERFVLSVRQMISSPESDPVFDITPHVPGLLLQVAEKCQLSVGDSVVGTAPTHVRSETEMDELVSFLEKTRRLPVIVVSEDNRDSDSNAGSDAPISRSPPVDAADLAKAMAGLANVYFLPAEYTHELTKTFGRDLSVFHGGVRIYRPGLDASDHRRSHPLFLGDSVRNDPDARAVRQFVARESLRRTVLGRSLFTFAAVRSAAAKRNQEDRAGASEKERLEAANLRIEALEKENEDLKNDANKSLELAIEEQEGRRDTERVNLGLQARLRGLEEKLSKQDIEPDVGLEYPTSWDGFSDWCEHNFAGRLVLASQARRNVRKPEFDNPRLAARCLRWLAHDYLNMRLGGGGKLAEPVIEDGIQDTPCGGDEFQFKFEGQPFTADWHLKNGGNTRDPKRCLRIYYCFDEEEQRVVVADMPAHRRSDIT